MRKSASIAVLIAALAPGLALADACMGRSVPGMQQGSGTDGPGGAMMERGMMDRGMMDRGMGPDFAALDSNGDGKVTADEVTVLRQTQFAAADANGDGKLEAAEVTVWIEARRAEREATMAARMIDRMDQDGDDALSLVELPGADMANRLGWLDRNADGAIDAEEFAAVPGGPGHAHGMAQRGPDGCGSDGHGRWGMH